MAMLLPKLFASVFVNSASGCSICFTDNPVAVSEYTITEPADGIPVIVCFNVEAYTTAFPAFLGSVAPNCVIGFPEYNLCFSTTSQLPISVSELSIHNFEPSFNKAAVVSSMS